MKKLSKIVALLLAGALTMLLFTACRLLRMDICRRI